MSYVIQRFKLHHSLCISFRDSGEKQHLRIVMPPNGRLLPCSLVAMISVQLIPREKETIDGRREDNGLTWHHQQTLFFVDWVSG